MRTFVSILTLLVLIFATSGCFTSEEPFFGTPENIIEDNLLPGTYRHSNQLDGSHWEIRTNQYGDIGYEVTYFAGASTDHGSCQMKFLGFLFLAGTNRFLNLTPRPTACDTVAGSPQSVIEYLRAVMLKPKHLVVKVCQSTNGPAFSVATQDSYNKARQKTSESLWTHPGSQMIADPAKQYEFLVNFGGDTNIFPAPQIVKYVHVPPKPFQPPRVDLSSNAYERIRPQQAAPTSHPR